MGAKRECKATLALLQKIHADRKVDKVNDALVKLEALAGTLKEEGLVGIFLKEGGLAAIGNMLSDARLFPKPSAMVNSCLKVLLEIPGTELDSKIMSKVVTTVTVSKEVHGLVNQVLNHSLLENAPVIGRGPTVRQTLEGFMTNKNVNTVVVIHSLLLLCKAYPENRKLLRQGTVVPVLMSYIKTNDEYAGYYAVELLYEVFEEKFAPMFMKYELLTVLIDMLRKTVRHQLAALRLIGKFLVIVNKDLDQATLTALLDFISSAQSSNDVGLESGNLLKIILEDYDRLLKVLHLRIVNAACLMVVMKPLIMSTDPKLQQFGAALLNKVCDIRFECVTCKRVITGGRRYCSASRTSICLNCPLTEVYSPEPPNFLNQMFSLMRPAAGLLSRELEDNNMNFGKVLDLVSVFAKVSGSQKASIVDTEGEANNVVTLILKCLRIPNTYPDHSELQMRALQVLRVMSTERPQTIGAIALPTITDITLSNEYHCELFVEIAARCVAHAPVRDVEHTVVAIMPKSYTDREDVLNWVAACFRNALSVLPEESIEKVISEGLTSSLIHILESKYSNPDAQSDAMFVIAKSIQYEIRPDILCTPLLLKAVVEVFQHYPNTTKLASATSSIVKYLIQFKPSQLPPSTVPPYGSGRQSSLMATVSSMPDLSVSTTSSRKSEYEYDTMEILRQKGAGLLSEAGLQMLWLFATGSIESVHEDAAIIMLCLAPMMDMVTKEQAPYVLNVLTELKDHRMAKLFYGLAVEANLGEQFTKPALGAVIDCAGSVIRECQECAVKTLKKLYEGPLNMIAGKDQQVAVHCRYNGEIKKLELNGDVSVQKLKKKVRDLYQGLDVGGPMRIGTKEVTNDNDLAEMMTSGIMNVELCAQPQTPRTPKEGQKRKWKIGRELGAGAFGTVYHVVDEETTEQCAAKCFDLNQRNDPKQKLMESFMNEISLLSILEHENIVRYIDTTKRNNKGYIIIEYMPGGSLLDFRKKFNTIPERMAAKFMTHALNGLEYLHRHCVIHLDVKSANLLINTEGVVKVADFGCGVRFEVDGETQTDGRTTGTLPFMAPEVIVERRFSTACDIWSLGCTLIEMVCGGLIWCPKCEDPAEYVYKVKREYAKGLTPLDHLGKHKLSSVALSFLKRCLVMEPSQRATATELLDDPFTSPAFGLNLTDATLDSSNTYLMHIASQTHRGLERMYADPVVDDATIVCTEPPPTQTLMMTGPLTSLSDTCYTTINVGASAPKTPRNYNVSLASRHLSLRRAPSTSPPAPLRQTVSTDASSPTTPSRSSRSSKKSTPLWNDGTDSSWKQGTSPVPSKFRE